MSSKIDILLERKTVKWLEWKLFGEKIEGILVDKMKLTEDTTIFGRENRFLEWNFC